MNFPENLRYSKEHTWLLVEGNIGTVGITEFAQDELGEIVYVDFPNIGLTFQQDKVFGSVEAIKTVSDLFMPVTGKIIEVNKALHKEPTSVNFAPYAKGWIMKIEIIDEKELLNLLSAQEYKAMIGN